MKLAIFLILPKLLCAFRCSCWSRERRSFWTCNLKLWWFAFCLLFLSLACLVSWDHRQRWCLCHNLQTMRGISWMEKESCMWFLWYQEDNWWTAIYSHCCWQRFGCLRDRSFCFSLDAWTRKCCSWSHFDSRERICFEWI